MDFETWFMMANECLHDFVYLAGYDDPGDPSFPKTDEILSEMARLQTLSPMHKLWCQYLASSSDAIRAMILVNSLRAYSEGMDEDIGKFVGALEHYVKCTEIGKPAHVVVEYGLEEAHDNWKRAMDRMDREKAELRALFA